MWADPGRSARWRSRGRAAWRHPQAPCPPSRHRHLRAPSSPRRNRAPAAWHHNRPTPTSPRRHHTRPARIHWRPMPDSPRRHHARPARNRWLSMPDSPRHERATWHHWRPAPDSPRREPATWNHDRLAPDSPRRHPGPASCHHRARAADWAWQPRPSLGRVGSPSRPRSRRATSLHRQQNRADGRRERHRPAQIGPQAPRAPLQRRAQLPLRPCGTRPCRGRSRSWPSRRRRSRPVVLSPRDNRGSRGPCHPFR